MGSRKGSKASKSVPASASNHHHDEELLVTKGSSKSERSASPSSPEVQLKVNHKFAQAFEERKRKEELTALERRGANWDDDDDEESDSETEDEDGEELTRELDSDITKTLKLIRKKDPAIYDSSIAFFKEVESEDEGSKKGKKKGSTPLYYKDLVRQQVIAGDVSGSEDEEDSEPVQTYAQEQEQIKKDFLASLKEKDGASDEQEGEQGEDLDGGLFSVRKKTEGEQKEEEEDYAAFTNKYGTKLKKGEVNPEKFLEHYLSSEGWKDKTDVVPHYDEIVKEDEEDAEELEKAEDFEHTYNFRFEEQGGSVIQTHARRIEDTVRREDDSRKRKRAERKERKALERQKKEEELRRLKNLKQAEIQHKLKKVARLMGEDENTVGLKPEDLEGDFDPEEYDKRMQAVFDEQYYDEDDDDMEKPTWDEEEDKELFAGLPVDPEEEEEKSPENTSKMIEEAEEQEDDEEEQDGEEGEEAPSKKMTKEEMQREKQKYLDELYGLDYEDLIGDIKCRFKYRQVLNNDFGLTVDEIMAADDKDLKQLVSLKRMAPYTDMEYNVDRQRLKNFKKSVREAREENRRRKHTTEAAETSEAQNGEAEQSKKKRKRNKKKKAVEGEEAKPEEDEAESKPNSKKVKKENAESAEEKISPESEKKKKRRSKKKSGAEKNSYAATGLPTSRLESYKLVKASKK
ncbi:Protein kri1 [Phytophthora ramorum]|uniref:Protein kri1 n=1 Tax=Phytophthora ramorum TaxID=164328 RepID=UPI0030AF90A7|nr:Protein kri1 [Phytophthora ramorum]